MGKGSIMEISFAIITCSDTRSLEEDEAGHTLAKDIEAHEGWSLIEHVICADDRSLIGKHIVHAIDKLKADIVLTCGGTGLSQRDVTPEATMDVCDRMVPGIAEAMRAHSLTITGRAMLSRALCMQKGSSLVINLPGSTKAASENWEGIVDQIEHAVKMAGGGGHPA